MIMEQIQAGSSVESACRKCKTVTDHHVVVMLDDKIGKVQCKVCSGKHAYRPPKEEPLPKAPRVKKAAAGKKAVAPKKLSPEVTAHWEKMVQTTPQENMLPYSMSGAFQPGDVISHTTFGPGYVQQFIKPNMIEVLFQDSVKKLRCCA
ncbi:hypothetical protein SAMN05660653_00928 [Desulfonatronum thiosulfatophilum]|uniref:Uncharacterized protein n=2 Tax=Desulfonatronum thiosulfatophilum TaxID=617002 RepID=A0A1G6BDL6_9BACT|nr:hypothetical protein SAMN05660653_00928 [Desulfonatronum thiosulfatophilum]